MSVSPPLSSAPWTPPDARKRARAHGLGRPGREHAATQQETRAALLRAACATAAPLPRRVWRLPPFLPPTLPPSAGLSRAATGRRAVVTTRAGGRAGERLDPPHAAYSRAPQCSTGPPGGAGKPRRADGRGGRGTPPGRRAGARAAASGRGFWETFSSPRPPAAGSATRTRGPQASFSSSFSSPAALLWPFLAGSVGTIKMFWRVCSPEENSCVVGTDEVLGQLPRSTCAAARQPRDNLPRPKPASPRLTEHGWL